MLGASLQCITLAGVTAVANIAAAVCCLHNSIFLCMDTSKSLLLLQLSRKSQLQSSNKHTHAQSRIKQQFR